MTIRSRLRLSYMAMLVIPIILSTIVITIIGRFYMNDLETVYNFKYNKKASIEQFMNSTAPIMMTIRNNVTTNPALFESSSYLEQLDNRLSSSHSGLVVRKNDSIVYASKFLNVSEIATDLPPYYGYMENRRIHPLVGDRIFQQIDFRFKDGSVGSVFLVTDISFIQKTVVEFLITAIISVLVILGLTNAALTFLMSKSIVDPLESLKNGALQIKNGNLDFQFETSSQDEIGEVGSAFEEMRQQLKESINVQQQYENNRKELISNISHDLKTPITAIKGYVEGILDGVADSPEMMEKYIKTISTKAADLDRLIDELFIFSKLDLNKLPFNIEQFDIKRYLEDCSEELQFDLEDKHISLNFKTSSGNNSLIVEADREKLKRVINNIVSNAVKYMGRDNGHISIELIDYEYYVLIKIEDNGKGISENDLPYIFDRFYRADQSRNTLTGGSGLGLAISKLIIEEFGGKIWAESKEGLGTSIFFTLKKIQ